MLVGIVVGAVDSNEPLSIDEKIRAFDEFEKAKSIEKQLREGDLDEVLAKRKNEAKKRQDELDEFLANKAKEKRIKPEDTPGYEDYLLQKWQWRHKQEEEAAAISRLKKNLKPGKKEREFELREYALQDSEKNRIPFNKRKILGGKPGGTSTSGGHSGGSGGGSGGGGGSSPYIPPPPIEDVPDFDNDIPPPPPPPPPPPMGGSDFDDPEPVPIPPPPPPLE